jgi:CheY-like chemotaxis protein
VATILVIDDEPMILKNMEMILEFEGFHVFTSLEGKTAMEILRSQPVNLILCDMLMVPMNGFEILQAVQQNPRTQRIPFIFVTGVKWNQAEAPVTGGSGYLIKPFTRVGLLDVVQQHLVMQSGS